MPELFPQEYCHIMTFYDIQQLSRLCSGVISEVKTKPETLIDDGYKAMTWLHANASYTKRCQNFLDQVRVHINAY